MLKLVILNKDMASSVVVSDGVSKTILSAGNGPNVQKGNTITVHCTGILSQTNKKFWRSDNTLAYHVSCQSTYTLLYPRHWCSSSAGLWVSCVGLPNAFCPVVSTVLIYDHSQLEALSHPTAGCMINANSA